eukprot:g17957.t1
MQLVGLRDLLPAFEKKAQEGDEALAGHLGCVLPAIDDKLDGYLAENRERETTLLTFRNLDEEALRETPAEEFHAFCLETLPQLRKGIEREASVRKEKDAELGRAIDVYAGKVQEGIRVPGTGVLGSGGGGGDEGVA